MNDPAGRSSALNITASYQIRPAADEYDDSEMSASAETQHQQQLHHLTCHI